MSAGAALADGRVPTTFADRMIRAWSQAGLGEMEIGLELVFVAPLDEARLRAAFARLVAHEPVVGCRYELDERGEAWWVPLPAFAPLARVETLEEFEATRRTPLRADQGAQVRATWVRTGAGDRLGLMISHELADAGGLKHLARLLAHFYSEPSSSLPSASPHASRSMGQVLERMSRAQLRRARADALRMMWRARFPGRSVHSVQSGTPADGFVWVERHLGRDEVHAVAAAGKRHGATLNDMLMAAFLLATHRTAPPAKRSRLRLTTTADLRRYMPGGAIDRLCNLSSLEVTTIPNGTPLDLDGLVAEVVRQTSRRKARDIGIALTSSYPLVKDARQSKIEAFSRWMFADWRRSGGLTPALTNMGPIRKEDLDFGGTSPEQAWLLVPPIFPPYFGTGVSGYDGTLTLTAGVTPSFRATMAAFFEELVTIALGRGLGRDPR